MRVSVIPNDPGRQRYEEMLEENKVMRVLLNGNEVFDVVTADDEKAFVTSYRTNDDGTLFMDETGSLTEVTERGDVSIDFVIRG